MWLYVGPARRLTDDVYITIADKPERCRTFELLSAVFSEISGTSHGDGSGPLRQRGYRLEQFNEIIMLYPRVVFRAVVAPRDKRVYPDLVVESDEGW